MSDKELVKPKTLPAVIWVLVCLFSTVVGGFFGIPYRFPGIITAGIGGLVAGFVWCHILRKHYSAMKFPCRGFFITGVAIGVLVGVGDGILLNIVGVSLITSGVISGDFLPRTYFAGIIIGSISGAIGGFANGLLWATVTTIMYARNKKLVQLNN